MTRVKVDPHLVRAWIDLQHTDPESSEYEERFEAFWPIEEMTHQRPEEAWIFILAVMEADHSEYILANLAAGPLEDLLVYHGDTVIARVETAAKANPTFAFLLGGVWRNAISQEVWDRICAVRDLGGWDGESK